MNKTKALSFKDTLEKTRLALQEGREKEYIEIKEGVNPFKNGGEQIIDFIIFNAALKSSELAKFLNVRPDYVDNIIKAFMKEEKDYGKPWRHPRFSYFFLEAMDERYIKAFDNDIIKKAICFFTYNFYKVSMIPLWIEQVIEGWIINNEFATQSYIGWAVSNIANLKLITRDKKEALKSYFYEANEWEKSGFYQIRIFRPEDFGSSIRYKNFVRYLNDLREEEENG